MGRNLREKRRISYAVDHVWIKKKNKVKKLVPKRLFSQQQGLLLFDEINNFYS